MEFSVSDAAKLVSKGRTTLYRDMDSGRLSYSTDETGKRSIDVSELTRVYGSIKGFGTGETSADSPESVPSIQNVTPLEHQHLREQLDFYKTELEHMRYEREKLLSVVEEQAKSVKALMPSEASKEADELDARALKLVNESLREKNAELETELKRPWWRKVFG